MATVVKVIYVQAYNDRTFASNLNPHIQSFLIACIGVKFNLLLRVIPCLNFSYYML
jgi:hypothetical protein